jgi:hypothetical protein
MSDSPVTNENMIPQGPPLVNAPDTSAQANNVIEYPTPPASPAPIHPPRLERRNNNLAPVLMCTDLDCPDLILDPNDFDYDSVLEPANPNFHELFDPSIFRYTGYGPVLERSDSIRHTGAADTGDLIQPSILRRSGFIPPPTLIRNDSRPSFDNDNDDGPPPLIRLCSDTFPHVHDFPSEDEYDVVERDNFEWFPKESSSSP